MEMTFADYINNPMGRNNAVISNREMHRAHYTDKFNKILLRENGKIDYSLYKDKTNFYIHIKIPSETVPEFYYDIVVMFYPHNKTASIEKSLDNYFIKFYSNDPAFVYTFAHAFIKNDLFIDDLKSKMAKEAVKKNADEKNPKNEVGYVKTIYFAYLFMKNKSLFNKVNYLSAPDYKKNLIIDQVMYAEDKIKSRQEAGEEFAKKKRVAKEKAKNDLVSKATHTNISNMSSDNLRYTGKVGMVKKTGTISSSNNSFIRKTKNSKKI